MEISYSFWDYLSLYLLRPLLAFLFVVALLVLGWCLAWKLVLVHVPLVQEIFGLRKKPAKPKPPARRLSRYYSTRVQNSNSGSYLTAFATGIILAESQYWGRGKILEDRKKSCVPGISTVHLFGAKA